MDLQKNSERRVRLFGRKAKNSGKLLWNETITK